MNWVRRIFPKVNELPKDASFTPIWPEEVLARARRGVVRSGYSVTGGESSILDGSFDHWPVIQAACYALCDDSDISTLPVKKVEKAKKKKKEKLPRDLTIEEKLNVISREVENKLREKP